MRKKTRYPKLSDIYSEGIGDLYGAITFKGTGNYGVGNHLQLAGGLDPAVQKIKDQEDEEHNQNIDNQQFISGRYKKSFGGPIGPIEPTQGNINRGIGANPRGALSHLKTPMVQKLVQNEQRVPGDWMYRDMKGTPIDSLERPTRHVPSDHRAEIESDKKSSLEQYMDEVEAMEEYLSEVYPYTTIDNLGDSSREGRVDQFHWLIAPRDFLRELEPQEDTPYGQMGVLVAPKKFVPDSFEGSEGPEDDWAQEQYEEYRKAYGDTYE